MLKGKQKEQYLVRRISALASIVRQRMEDIVIASELLEALTKNRIAAHKAHTTMAKSKGGSQKDAKAKP